MNSRAVIIGGGITGLAAAERIVAQLGPGTITLIESAQRLGGKIATEETNGFVLEKGPDSFLASKPGGMALCEHLGLADRIIDTNAGLRRSFVKRDDRLFALPDGLTGLVPSRLTPLLTSKVLSPRGKLRAALEMVIPCARGDADESVGSFVRRRFGGEAWRRLVEPLLSGIYAGDGDALSLRSTFPQLRQTERRHGSILRPHFSVLSKARVTPRGFVTLAGGMQELADTLASRLTGERVLTGVSAMAVARVREHYAVTLSDGTVIITPVVIAALPAHAAAPILRPLDEQLSRELDTIPFVSTATVSLAFARRQVSHVLDGFGYVSPRAEGGAVVACTWTSNKFPVRAPLDHVLVRLFLGRAGLDAVVSRPGDELVAMARDELKRVHGITAEPNLVRVARWERAMPQYNMGHDALVSSIFQRAAGHAGLFMAGASYRGVGIPDCITSAWSAADAALSYLQET